MHSEIKLGPVSLRVRDVDLMLLFYEKELGLKVLRHDGDSAELGTAQTSSLPLLILKHDPKAEKAPPDAAGLYHYALLLPARKSLAAAYLALGDAGIVFDGFADHLVSEALYLTDPEGNGMEIYADRPRSEWKFDEDGHVQMATQPLDIDSLLKELPAAPKNDQRAIADGTKIGHIHLKVTDMQRSIAFYQMILGLDLMSYWGSAAFLSVGRYHHHVGINTWESLGGPTMRKGFTGLENFVVNVPEGALQELSSRLTGGPFLLTQNYDNLFVTDPDGIELLIKASN